MKSLSHIAALLLIFLLAFSSCQKIQKYPDEPTVEYKGFNLFLSQDVLGNSILLGELNIGFTDGDGDIGIEQPDSAALADSLKYNLFLTMWVADSSKWVKSDEKANVQNFRIPYIERTGQNKTLSGTITVSLEYKTIQYDSIRYTFYLLDRQFHKSNVDTSETVIFKGLQLDSLGVSGIG
ncbi:MAG TPA: hypothetical protein VE870_08280, partial [Bacteroidales bacterium]|nr:hypothetical protein [Bacteroidales bacterium]